MKSNNKNLMPDDGSSFEEIVEIIERARENAFRAVNRELIAMYWEIGWYISEKCKTDGWGKSVVKTFSEFVQSRYVGIKGFSPQNIWRMKQFYETYANNEKLSPLVREISWTNNVLILMQQNLTKNVSFICYFARKTTIPNANWSVRLTVASLSGQ